MTGKGLLVRAAIGALTIVVLAAAATATAGLLAVDELADVIRQRLRVNGVVRSLTAEGRMQTNILIALPIVSLLVMTVIGPEYARQLYDRPWLLAGTGVSMLIGWLWMRRIINFGY